MPLCQLHERSGPAKPATQRQMMTAKLNQRTEEPKRNHRFDISHDNDEKRKQKKTTTHRKYTFLSGA